MRRILVIGSGGAGKSVLATELGRRLGLPVIHLVIYFWKPGWVETPRGEWQGIVEELISRPAWVVDGNYSGTLDIRIRAADTIIFLDISRWICLWRALSRVVRYCGKNRPDLAEGCPERFDWPFLKWIWHFPSRERRAILAKLEKVAIDKQIHTLRSVHEADIFLNTI